MQQSPLVSVILPIYNNEKYLVAALESVLDQTYVPLEIICINDGSTDTTSKILQTFTDKITILTHETNLGIGAARNSGVSHAQGEYIALMDADDLWHPKKIELQIQELRKNPEMSMVFCMVQNFISPELPPAVQALRHCPKDPMPGILPPASLINRKVFDRIGNFDPTLKMGEFIDLFARAKDAGFTYGMVPHVLLRRRIHTTNTGITHRNSRTDFLKVVRREMERKRRSSGSET